MKGRLTLLAICIVSFAGVAVFLPEDRNIDQRTYCNNVREGVWPDFKHSFKAECGGKDPLKFNEDLTK